MLYSLISCTRPSKVFSHRYFRSLARAGALENSLDSRTAFRAALRSSSRISRSDVMASVLIEDTSIIILPWSESEQRRTSISSCADLDHGDRVGTQVHREILSVIQGATCRSDRIRMLKGCGCGQPGADRMQSRHC